MTAPAWLPDWRDASQYPTTRTMLEWRWEFLRRRADYQTTWAETLMRHASAMASHAKLRQRLTAGDPQECFDAAEKLAQIAGIAETMRPFGLRDGLDPAKSYRDADLRGYFSRPDWGGVLDLREGEAAEAYAEGVVIVAFDLRHDLETQLRDTRTMLEDERRSLNVSPAVARVHPARWATYLRVLDARASGCTLRQIAEDVLGLHDLPPDEQAARAHQKLDDAQALLAKLTS